MKTIELPICSIWIVFLDKLHVTFFRQTITFQMVSCFIHFSNVHMKMWSNKKPNQIHHNISLKIEKIKYLHSSNFLYLQWKISNLLWCPTPKKTYDAVNSLPYIVVANSIQRCMEFIWVSFNAMNSIPQIGFESATDFLLFLWKIQHYICKRWEIKTLME